MCWVSCSVFSDLGRCRSYLVFTLIVTVATQKIFTLGLCLGAISFGRSTPATVNVRIYSTYSFIYLERPSDNLSCLAILYARDWLEIWFVCLDRSSFAIRSTCVRLVSLKSLHSYSLPRSFCWSSKFTRPRDRCCQSWSSRTCAWVCSQLCCYKFFVLCLQSKIITLMYFIVLCTVSLMKAKRIF